MNVSRTLREYIETTVTDKVTKKQAKIHQEKDERFKKIIPQIDKLISECLQKTYEIIEGAGLDPEEYNYAESRIYRPRIFPYPGPKRSDIRKNVNDIVLKIELEMVPKDKIMEYIDTYDVTISED